MLSHCGCLISKPQTIRMNQLINGVGRHSRRNPLASMNSSFNEDSRVPTLLRYLQSSDLNSLVSRPQAKATDESVLFDLLVHPSENRVQVMVIVPVELGCRGVFRLYRGRFIVNQLLNVVFLRYKKLSEKIIKLPYQMEECHLTVYLTNLNSIQTLTKVVYFTLYRSVISRIS